MDKGASELDDSSGWAIEASLRATGPVLRQRARHTDRLEGAAKAGILLQVSDPALFADFSSRAEALAAVRHAAVTPPLRTGTHRGRPYRIDPLLAAPRLSEAAGALDLTASLDLVRHLAEGLAALHARGIIHGNVHPETIAIDTSASGPAARFVESPAVSAGPWLRNAAPEVLRGGLADARTDVFGLGLVLWSLVTGRDPREESRNTWADERPGPVLQVAPDLPLTDAQATLLRRMLDRTPEPRPASMADVLRVLGGGAPIVAPRAAPVAVPVAPRSGPGMASGGLLLGVGTAAVGVMGLAAAGLIFLMVRGPADVGPSSVVQPSPPAPLTAHATEPAPAAKAPAAPDAPLPVEAAPPTTEPDSSTPPADGLPAPEAAPLEPAPGEQSSAARAASREPAASAPPETTSGSNRPAEPTAANPAPPASTGTSQSPDPPDPETTANEPTDPVPSNAEPADAEPADAEPADAEPADAEPRAEDPSPTEPTASTPAPEPESPAPSPDVLNGRWIGTVNGRPAVVQLIAAPGGSLSGVAEVRVGARVEQHAIYGKYQLGAEGTASIALGLRGTRTTWSGRLRGTTLSGAVLVSGKERGDFALGR